RIVGISYICRIKYGDSERITRHPEVGRYGVSLRGNSLHVELPCADTHPRLFDGGGMKAGWA
ncbi:MAG: hypothetical protein ACRD10_00715, partial [Terriglobia bacterium]